MFWLISFPNFCQVTKGKQKELNEFHYDLSLYMLIRKIVRVKPSSQQQGKEGSRSSACTLGLV